MLNTIRKVGEVLDLFDRDHPEWGVSEAAQRLGAAKSSTHDLMASLVKIGLLSQTDKGRYRLGWRIVDLSEALLATTTLRTVARPFMKELIDTYQETIHLALLERGKVVYLDKLEGRQAIRVELTGLGVHLYPHCSALGKVLLADLPWEEVQGIVAQQGLPSFTEQTITDEDSLKQELCNVATQGYAFDMEEILPDLCCVGAPIRDYRSQVIAAISMSVPAYRLKRSRDDFRNAIVRSAKMISRQLGYF
jgi:DNA-binding IclR family transcriptional regulator